MNSKFKGVVLLSLFICILCMGIVSANDDVDCNTTLTQQVSYDVDLTDNVLSSSPDEGDVLSAPAGTFKDLQARINETPAKGTLALDGDYVYDASVDGDLVNGIVIDKQLTLTTATGNQIVIDGANSARLFNVSGTVTFNNFTFKNGNAVDGAAVYSESNNVVTFNFCNFIENTASNNGGAIYKIRISQNANGVILNDCRLYNNTAVNCGGAVCAVNSYVGTARSFYRENTAAKGGVFYANNSRVNTASNSLFYMNSADTAAIVYMSNLGTNSHVTNFAGCIIIQNPSSNSDSSKKLFYIEDYVDRGSFTLNNNWWGTSSLDNIHDITATIGAVPEHATLDTWIYFTNDAKGAAMNATSKLKFSLNHYASATADEVYNGNNLMSFMDLLDISVSAGDIAGISDFTGGAFYINYTSPENLPPYSTFNVNIKLGSANYNFPFSIAPDGSYTALQVLIDSSDSSLTLERDYEFYPDFDNALALTGVVIDKPFVLDGNNHSIDGLHLACCLRVLSDDVIVRNITLNNGYRATSGTEGAGIYWKANNAVLDYVNTNYCYNYRGYSGQGAAIIFRDVGNASNVLITNCVFTGDDDIVYDSFQSGLYIYPTYGGNITLINVTTDHLRASTFYMYNADNVYVEGGSFHSSSSPEAWNVVAAVVSNCKNVTFVNNTLNFHGTTAFTDNFRIYYSENITFINNTFGNNFRSRGTFAVFIANTTLYFENNTMYRPPAYYSNSVFNLNGRNTADIIFKDNYISTYNGNGYVTSFANFVNVDVHNNTYYYNAKGNVHNVININNDQNVHIYNNTFNDNHMQLIGAANTNNLYIYNNTVTRSSSSHGLTGDNLFTFSNINYTLFENNTIGAHHSTIGTALEGSMINSINSTIIINNNSFNGFYNSANNAYLQGIIYIDGGSCNITNNNFSNCKVYAQGGMGLICNLANDTLIINNTFYNTVGQGSIKGVVIYNAGDYITIENNTFTTSSTTKGIGGAIYNIGNNVTISHNNFTGNVATDTGVIYSTGNDVIIEYCNITNSHSTGSIGAFHIEGLANISNIYFERIYANGDYGVIYCDNADGTIMHNITYFNNHANSKGMLAIGNNITVYNQNFTDNYVNNGQAGSIMIMGGDNNLTDIYIYQTRATFGGAICNVGDYNNLTNITIIDSNATFSYGGAIYSTGNNLTVNILDISSSTTILDGGAIYNDLGKGNSFNHVTIDNVRAGHDGGAIYLTGDDSSICNINITNTYADRHGGAIYWSGKNGTISYMNIINSTSDGDGGAIYWIGSEGKLSYITLNHTNATSGGAVYWTGANGLITQGCIDNIFSYSDGGAIYWIGSTPTLTYINFTSIICAANGGAIYGTSANANMDNLIFDDINITGKGGAVYWTGSDGYLDNSIFTNINASSSGGAVYWTGDRSRIKSSKFSNVSSNENGGAVYWTGVDSNITNSTFANASARGQGGAVYWTGLNGNITNSTFDNDIADGGGAISWSVNNAFMYNLTITNCNASNNGGAINLAGASSTLNLLNLTNNSATKGGAIYLMGSNPILYGIYACNNTATSDGGAINLDGADAHLYDSVFDNNTAAGNGGAVNWIGTNGNINNITFSNNNARIGGAFYLGSQYVNLFNLTFTNNTASIAGAVYMGGMDNGKLFNSTFKDNNASGTAGTIYWYSGSGLLENVTIDGSNSLDAGAIYWLGDSGDLLNVTFNNVFAYENGGVLYIAGSDIEISDSVFSGSSANNGAAMYWIGHRGKLINVLFENNTAENNGGGLYLVGSDFAIVDTNFTNNTASNLGGGIYWVGSGSIDNANFSFNNASGGSAIFNAGSVMISNTTLLNNTANISSIEVTSEEFTNSINLTATVRGNDNFLNAIHTTSNSIQVRNVTYWGINGVMVSDDEYITPVEGVDESKLYYDSRLPNIEAGLIIKKGNSTSGILYSNYTDINGTISYEFIKSNAVFNVTTYHEYDSYYEDYSISQLFAFGVPEPVLDLIVPNEVLYDHELNVTVTLIAYTADEYGLPVLILVNGTVVITVDDTYKYDFYVSEGRSIFSQVLPVFAGQHNISAYFAGSIDPELKNTTSKLHNFTVVKTPLEISVSANTSTVNVGDSVNITISVSEAYTGVIQYIAGNYSGRVPIYGNYSFEAVYGENGTVNVYVIAPGDNNYLAAMESCSFNVVKNPISMEFVNVTSLNYLTPINVGDPAIITVKLSGNDSTGNVIFNINNNNYTAVIDNGYASVTVYNLTSNNIASLSYNIVATYGGDNKYYAANPISATLVVNKIDTEITVNPINQSILVGENASFEINIKSLVDDYVVNGNATLVINNVRHNVSINNGTGFIKVHNLLSDVYYVDIIYDGDLQFNGNTVINISNVTVEKVGIKKITVTPASQDLYVGQSADLTIEIESNVTGYNINDYANVVIGNKTYVVVINNNIGSLTTNNLTEGIYYVNVSYAGNDIYNPFDEATYATINVDKVDIEKITVTPTSRDIYVGQSANFTITMLSKVIGYDVNGFVTVTVNNKSYNVSISNNSGFVSIGGLYEGSYDVNVSYAGDDTYNSFADAKYATIKVDKVGVKITVTPDYQSIDVGQSTNINISMEANITGYVVNDYVTLTVGDKQFNVSIVDNNGSVTIPAMTKGLYNVTVSYAGNNIFNSVAAKKYAEIDVGKVDIDTITVTPESQSIFVGQEATLNIKINSTNPNYEINDYVTVTVANTQYNVSINRNSGILTISDLKAGNWDVNVSYAGSEIYSKKVDAKYATIDVNKFDIRSITVSPKSQSILVGQDATIDIRVVPNSTAYINDYVTVSVNGTKYNVSIINNQGSLTIDGLTSGVWDVNVSYAGSELYKPVSDSNYANITANKVNIASIIITANESSIYVNQNAVFEIEAITSNPDYVFNDFVTVTIGSREFNVSIINGTGSLVVNDLAYGLHDVNVSYVGSDIYNAKPSKKLTAIVVNKVNIASIDVIPSSQDIYVGQNANLTIKMNSDVQDYNVSGFVTVTIDNKQYNVSIIDNIGLLTVYNLAYGLYPVNIAYAGNDIYNSLPASDYASINVNKVGIREITVSPVSQDIYVGQVANLTVNMVADVSGYDVSGFVTVTVGGKSYNVSISDNVGSLAVSGLGYGSYDVDVVYAGSDVYNSVGSAKYADIDVNKVDIVNIIINPSYQSIDVGQLANISITLESMISGYDVYGFVTVTVNNTDYNVSISNNSGSLTIPNLSKGRYNVTLSYAGNNIFNSVPARNYAEIDVGKVDIDTITVTPASQNIFVGQEATFNVKINSTNPDYEINDYVTVTVANKQYNVSISKNIGVLSISDLKAGVWDVNVSYAGNDIYSKEIDAKYATVTVNKVDIKNITVYPKSQIVLVGQDAIIDLNVIPNVTGYMFNDYVTAIVGGKEYNVSVINNIASLTIGGLTNGEYDVIISYAGSDIYNSLSDDTYANITVNKVNIASVSINAVESVIYVGQDAVFDIEIIPETPGYVVDNEYVTATIGDNQYNVSITNGTGLLIVKGLSNGTYNINASYAGSDVYYPKFNKKVSYLTVNKVDIVNIIVTPSSQDIYVGQNANITIQMEPSLTGYEVNEYVTVTVNNKQYNVSITSNTGSLSIPDLASGIYNVNIAFAGNDVYNSLPSVNYAKINVNKVSIGSITVTPSSQDIYVGQNANLTVRMKSNVTGYDVNGFVTVIVNNKENIIPIINNTGVLKLSPLNEGSYDVNVVYNGDNIFNSVDNAVYATINVGKVNIKKISVVPVSQDIYVGQVANITVKMESNVAGYVVNDYVTVIINNKSYNVSISNNSGSLIIPGLSEGKYDVNVSYNGNNIFNSVDNSKYANITVNKVGIKEISVVPESQDIYVGQVANLTVRMKSNVTGYDIDGYVIVTINNKEYIVSISNNSGSLNVSGLANGVYDVNITYLGSNIYSNKDGATYATINVNKVGISEITVTPGSQDIYVNQVANFTVNMKSNVTGYDINDYITVTINNIKYNVSINDNSGFLNVSGLKEGVYDVNVSYAGSDVYSNKNDATYATVKVNKVSISSIVVTPSSQDIYVGQVANLTVRMKSNVTGYDINGFVTVSINNTPYNVSIINNTGILSLSDLVNATYYVNVSYAGDNVYENVADMNYAVIRVNKIPTSIFMNNITMNVGDIANIKAVISSTEVTGNVTFVVDNKQYIVGIIDGVAHLNVSGLNTSANRTITAIYSGDYRFINSTTTASLNISKVYGNATIIVYNITAGDTETVIIKLPDDVSNATVTVKFNNIEIADYNRDNNVISFNRTLQVYGNYSVSVNVDDDCKYYDFSNSSIFTVFKVAPDNYTIVIDVNDTFVFENITVIINLPNDANETLLLSVDGKDNVSVDVIGGVATYNLGNLSYGNHTISVTYGNDKYDTKVVSEDVFVSKIASSINIVNPVDPRVAHDIIIGLTPENRSVGNITVTINNKTYNVTDRSFVNASDLLEGEYTVVAILAEDDNFFESTNTSVFIVKRNPVAMTLNDVVGDVMVDHSIILHVDLNETVTGSVIFNINGENFTVNITESDVAEYVWTPVSDGVVSIFASYLGNDTYYSNSTNTIVFDVYKNPIRFDNISVKDIMVDDIEHIVVSLNESDATGIITININGSICESTIINGSVVVDVSGLSAGVYKAVASYGGDFKYLATNAISSEFTVFKYDAPMFITADDIMILDDALVIVNVPVDSTGYISITVNGECIYVPVVNGSVSWTISNLSYGVYEVNAEYSGDYKYLANSSIGSFNVIRYNSTFDIIHSDAGWTGEDINMSVKLSGDATGNVTLSVNGTEYVLPVSDGRVDFTIPMLDAGDYEVVVSYSGDYKYADAYDSFNFTVNSNHPVIVADDVVKYYGGSERLYVNLTNVRGDKLSGETVYITINGVTYARVTNTDGVCSVPVNLITGEFEVIIVYNGSELYDSVSKVVNVTVLSTVSGEDLVKVFANASQYWAHFTDSNGNALVNTTVTFNINGVFYNRMTDENGWAKLNINLPPGEYIITAYNSVTGEKYSNNITVLSRIVENYDLVKKYRNASQFVVRLVDDYGNPVGAGERVEFNINGVYYTRTTDANGYAKLNINLPVGEYIITSNYMGCYVSNTIRVIE